MIGRERVTAALLHASPDRAPRDIWPLPAIHLFRDAEVAFEDIEAVYLAWPEQTP